MFLKKDIQFFFICQLEYILQIESYRQHFKAHIVIVLGIKTHTTMLLLCISLFQSPCKKCHMLLCLHFFGHCSQSCRRNIYLLGYQAQQAGQSVLIYGIRFYLFFCCDLQYLCVCKEHILKRNVVSDSLVYEAVQPAYSVEDFITLKCITPHSMSCTCT